jgi:hypothetical protein
MNVDNAIESLLSFAPDIATSPLFYVGELTDVCDAIALNMKELEDDVISGGIPFPFHKLTIIIGVDTRRYLESIANLQLQYIAYTVEAIRGNKHGITSTTYAYSPHLGWGCGKPDEINDILKTPSGQKFIYPVGILALISHPQNYILLESPELTGHERRRIASGKRFPNAKRPRYIVVDHDILVRLNKSIGTHAKPVPHQRRGHWMRLSERCRHARERGLEKVWVRDAYVGETDFIQDGRRYQVLLDFQDKVKAGVSPA